MIPMRSNIIDLAEYRRKLEQPLAQDADWEWDEGPDVVPLPPHPRYSSWMRRRGLALDHLASLGVLVMALAFTLRILVF